MERDSRSEYPKSQDAGGQNREPRSLRECLRVFRRDNRAIFLPVFALLFATMLAFLGLTFDGGRLLFEKRRMQVAADAGARGATFEILRGNRSMIDSAGKDDTALNGFEDAVGTVAVIIKSPPEAPTATAYRTASCAEAIITQDFPTTLMRAADTFSDSSVQARAVACVQADNGPPCVLALDCGSDEIGLEIDGDAKLFAHNCDIIVNSQKNPGSITINGTGLGGGTGCPQLASTGPKGRIAYGDEGDSTYSGLQNCVQCDGCEVPDVPEKAVSCYADPYCENLLPTSSYYPQGCYAASSHFPDPWSPGDTPEFSLPNITNGNWDNFVDCSTIEGGSSAPTEPCTDFSDPGNLVLLLPQGYYSTAGSGKGIVLNEGNVRLVYEAPAPDSPGCLFIADDFKVNGATLTAQNVTIYVTNVEEKLTGNPLTVLDIGANSNVTMSAPLSGTYQNMLLFLSRWSTNLACNVRGDATSLIDGAIYCPTGDLDYGGNSTFDVNSGYAAVIANQIRLHGTTNVGVTFEGGTGPRTSRFSKVNMVE